MPLNKETYANDKDVIEKMQNGIDCTGFGRYLS